MNAIYTQPWYESLKEILNRSDQVTKNAPRGVWHVLAEIKGDGASPYLAADDVRRFAIVLNDGKCDSYQELAQAPPRKDFEFILELRAGRRAPLGQVGADVLGGGVHHDRRQDHRCLPGGRAGEHRLRLRDDEHR